LTCAGAGSGAIAAQNRAQKSALRPLRQDEGLSLRPSCLNDEALPGKSEFNASPIMGAFWWNPRLFDAKIAVEQRFSNTFPSESFIMSLIICGLFFVSAEHSN
jgi:hypothetical protein